MATSVNTLMEEAKCYLCLGISQAEAMELALLNRIASSSSSEYVATITQTGVSAPVATVMQNGLGSTPVFTYMGIGQYHVDVTGLTLNKTVVSVGDNTAQITNLTTTGFDIFSYDLSIPGLADNILTKLMLRIQVYP